MSLSSRSYVCNSHNVLSTVSILVLTIIFIFSQGCASIQKDTRIERTPGKTWEEHQVVSSELIVSKAKEVDFQLVSLVLSRQDYCRTITHHETLITEQEIQTTKNKTLSYALSGITMAVGAGLMAGGAFASSEKTIGSGDNPDDKVSPQVLLLSLGGLAVLGGSAYLGHTIYMDVHTQDGKPVSRMEMNAETGDLHPCSEPEILVNSDVSINYGSDENNVAVVKRTDEAGRIKLNLSEFAEVNKLRLDNPTEITLATDSLKARVDIKENVYSLVCKSLVSKQHPPIQYAEGAVENACGADSKAHSAYVALEMVAVSRKALTDDDAILRLNAWMKNNSHNSYKSIVRKELQNRKNMKKKRKRYINYAKDCAHSLIYEHLKTPSTADFVATQLIGYRNDTYVYLVTLDAQNSFGAYIRQKYCTAITVDAEALRNKRYSFNKALGLQTCSSEESVQMFVSMHLEAD